MTEARRKKLMYGILVVAVIWGGWNFSRPRTVSLPIADQSIVAAVMAESTSVRQVPVDLDEKRTEPWGRDPFRSSTYRAKVVAVSSSSTVVVANQNNAPRKGWSLTGVIDNGTTPLAFINGKMVKVGDLVDQAKVVKIEKHKVTLSHNGSQFSLQVNKG
jgi:hypothetical protein